MYDTAIAIKDVIEPMFGNAIITAARNCADPGSDQEKDWIQKARQVCCSIGNYHAAWT